MNIYVGNLDYKLQENELEQLFGEYGEVSSVKIITDKYTGKSKGFGFVEMPDDENAEAAIEGLNGKEINGRQMRVNKARPRN
ncbi:MAG: RNA recognition motif domain-containing protein [Bacteroidales bacterium]